MIIVIVCILLHILVLFFYYDVCSAAVGLDFSVIYLCLSKMDLKNKKGQMMKLELTKADSELIIICPSGLVSFCTCLPAGLFPVGLSVSLCLSVLFSSPQLLQ